MGFFSVLALAEGAAVWARSSAHSTHTMHSISEQKKTRPVGLLQATLQPGAWLFDGVLMHFYCVLSLHEGAGIGPPGRCCRPNTLH